MPGILDYTAKLTLATNLPEILREAKKFQAELGAEIGHAPTFGTGMQAAGTRAREVAAKQGIPDRELAATLQALQRLVQQNVTGGGEGYRRQMAEGGYKQSTLTPPGSRVGAQPLFDGTEDAKMRALRIRQGTLAAAQLQEVLAGDAVYTGLQKRVAAAKATQAANLVEAQNADGQYTAIQKRLVAAKGTQQAKLLESQNADGEYAAVQKRLAAGKATQQAKLVEAQNADGEYTAIQKRLIAGKSAQQAKLLESQNADGEYTAVQKRIIAGKGTQQAKLIEAQNADGEYTAVQKRIIAGKGAQQAKLIESQNADGEYAGIQKRLAAGKANAQANLVEAQNADGEYASIQKRLAGAKATQAASVQEALASDADYIVGTARVSIARQAQAAEIQELIAGDSSYAVNTARVAIARQRQGADVQTLLAGDQQYIEASTRAAAAKKQQAAELQGSLNADPAYQTATNSLAREREIQKAQAAEAAASDGALRDATVRTTVAREQAKAELQSSLAADPVYARATVQAASAREQQSANLRAGLASDDQYIAATAMAARAREEQAAKVTLEQAGIGYRGLGRQDLLANASVAKKTEADLQAAAVARASLRGNQRGIQATVEKQVAESALANELRLRERQELRARIKSGETGGTGFQKLQALLSPTPRAPQSYATGGQMIGQKTITTAGYAIGGAAVSGAIFGTIEAIKDASKLQEQFAGLRGQMQAIGQENAFGEVRSKIKGISNETGVAASEVTKFASRLLGVFNDPEEALVETEAAMKLAVVSGTDLNTMLEELVPVARSFGVSITDIGDLAVSLHDKFGVAEEGTLHFLGAIAPVAEEAGLSLKETGVIGATAANSIGKSLNTAGEQFSKILPTMSQNQDKIYQILRARPETAGLADPLVEAFGRGDTGDAFKLLLGDYNKLNTAQQENLVKVSGGRREWALLNGLFQNSSKLLKDMEEAEAGVGKGGLSRRFEQVSQTLSRSIERIQESFKNVVEGLFSSGLGDALALIGKSVELVIGVVNTLIGAFTKLNEITRHVPGFDNTGLLAPIVQMGLAFAGATKAYSIFTQVRQNGGGITGLLARNEKSLSITVGQRSLAYTQGQAVLERDAAAKLANAEVTGEAAAAESGLITARSGATTAGAPGISRAAVGAGAGAVPLWQRAESGLLLPGGAATGAAADAAGPAAGSAGSGLVWLPALGRYRSEATGQFVSKATAESAGAFSHLPAPPMLPGRIGSSPLLTRALKGGSFLKSKAANQAASSAAANAARSAAATKAAAAATAEEAAAITAGGETAAATAAAGATTSSLGSVAASVPGIGIAVIGALVVKNARDEWSDKLNKEGDDLSEKLKTKSEFDLKKLAGNYDDIWDKAQAAILGTKTIGSRVEDEINRKKGERGTAAIGALQDTGNLETFTKQVSDQRLGTINEILNRDTGLADSLGANMEGNVLTKGLGLASKLSGQKLPFGLGKGEAKVDRENLKQILPEIKKRAKDGDENSNLLAQQIEFELSQNRTMSEVRKAVDDSIKAGDIKGAIDQAGGISQFLEVQGLNDPEGQLQTGQISRGEYVDVQRQKVEDLKKQLDAQQLGSDDREKAQKDFDQKLLQVQQTQDTINQERVEALKRTVNITSRTPKKLIFDADIKNVKTLSVPAQIARVPELITEQWDSFQEGISQYQSPQEAYDAASKGVDLDPETRTLAIMKNIKDSGKLSALARQANPGGDMDAFLRSIAEERIRTGKSMKSIIQERGEKKLRPVGADPANPDLDRFESDLSSLTDDDIARMEEDVKNLKEPPEKLDKIKTEQDTQIKKSVYSLTASLTTDPYVQASTDLQSAQADLDQLIHNKEIGEGGPTIDADINNAQARVNKALAASRDLVYSTEKAMEQWAVVLANGDPVAATAAQLDSAINDVERIRKENGGNEKDPKLIQARQAVTGLQFQQVDNLNEITRANMELEAFDRNQDPEAAAADALAMAQFGLASAKGDAAKAQAMLQVKSAMRSQTDAANEAFRAQRELANFDNNRDPEAAAQAALQEASIAVALAQGKGRGAEAAAALQFKTAQRAVQDVADALLAEGAQHAINLANLRQDSVGAALEAVKEAQRQLDLAKSKGLGKAAIQQATDDLAQKRSDAVDAAVADSEDITNFMLEMGQITQGQAIERLKVERDKYEVGSKKWRDLQLKIHAAEQGAGSDTQYNLPANITLPTLYEARRLNQSRQMGIGYMDNRNVNLTFNVSGAQDPAAVTNQVMGAIQSAMGGGQTYTPGIGVGAFN